MPRWTLILIVIVLAILLVAGAYVVLMVMNPNNPTPSPSPTPTGTAEPAFQEQVRDQAMNFIGSTHPETQSLTSDLSWTGGRQDTGLLGSEKYFYTSGGWAVEITNPVIPHPIYTISANYTKDNVSVTWTGTSENDLITETSYTVTGLTPVLTTQEQVRDTVMAYIQANHTETDTYLPVARWTGGRATPAGLVGYETYIYSGSGWNVTIGYVVYYDIIYNVNVTYVPPNSQTGHVVVNWTGTVHNGSVNETSYTYSPQASTSAVLGTGNLPLTTAYKQPTMQTGDASRFE
jgi:hypothetical protein